MEVQYVLYMWMDKQTVVHPYNGMLFGGKKRAVNPQKDMEETQMHIAKWEKPVWMGYILYDLNYIIFWKKETIEIIKRSMFARGSVEDGVRG